MKIRVAGVDEAGRGPLAGPVVAAAVILNNENNEKPPHPLGDSKTISPARRESIYEWLKNGGASAIGIGIVMHDEIDRINILSASLLAMKKAVLKLGAKPEMLLIDGKFTLDLPTAQKAIVKGDSKVKAISAASIAAKVVRDGIMRKYHSIYPQYGFDRHKGYPTKAHKEAIIIHGASPIHRVTFSGVRPVC